jgi:hypothetical protein
MVQRFAKRIRRFLTSSEFKLVLGGQIHDLVTPQPVNRGFGWDRGERSVARYYVDTFIAGHAADICGTVLEVGDATYTKRHGRRITRADVLHVDPAAKATITDDLTNASKIGSNDYNCVIATQTLQMIYAFSAAIGNIYRILAPGGVALVTLSGISQISRYDMERWGEYWRFTTSSAQKMFADWFGQANVEVLSYGNVLAAVALLEGIWAKDLSQQQLGVQDPDYQVILGVRATKAYGPGTGTARF